VARLAKRYRKGSRFIGNKAMCSGRRYIRLNKIRHQGGQLTILKIEFWKISAAKHKIEKDQTLD